ncbi:MAG: hypothetical protein J7M14_00160 [Planctomycetes bacterium]|nr:hypothetical protein [Planctomycetota bacterium]
MTRHKRGCNAMTLLEIVLALTIVVGVMGGLYGFYSHVLSTCRAVRDAAEQIAAVRIVMDRMTAELRSAKVYPFVNFGLEGMRDNTRFVTTVLPGPAAWAVRSATEEPVPPEHDLQLVGYRLRTTEVAGEETIVEGLERISQKVIAAPDAEEGEEIEVAFLTSHVKFLSLRYWTGNGWQDTWNGPDLPGAVEIVMGFEPLEEGISPDEYPYETFRRVVYVPGGVRAGRGTVVRGLGGRAGGGR